MQRQIASGNNFLRPGESIRSGIAWTFHTVPDWSRTWGAKRGEVLALQFASILHYLGPKSPQTNFREITIMPSAASNCAHSEPVLIMRCQLRDPCVMRELLLYN